MPPAGRPFPVAGLRRCKPLEALPDSEIAEALDALPASIRMTVYYADVCGYRYQNIADIMDILVGTVMSRLHRARRRLRVLLSDPARERCA